MADLLDLIIKDKSVGSAFRGVLARQQRFDHSTVSGARSEIKKLEGWAEEVAVDREIVDDRYAAMFREFPGGVL